MSQCAISCDLHDYIEIACMYGYRIRLVLKDNKIIEGKARDIVSVEKREYLVLVNREQEQRVELINLSKMYVLTDHAKFDEVSFK